MNRDRTLHFEPLEGRQLLSGAHARARHAATAVPLVFSGTLTVVNTAASANTNMDGGYTTSAPVVGQLSGVGHVHGVWYESTDQMGDYMGPDTITLHGPKGGFTIGFSNASSGPAHKVGRTVFYEHAQHVISSSGGYAGASESGTIDLNENRQHTGVVSMTLSS
jgi:hypothetical protein